MKSQLVLLVGVTCGSAFVLAQPGDEKPTWHADWPTAQRFAKREGKPIFAVMACKH